MFKRMTGRWGNLVLGVSVAFCLHGTAVFGQVQVGKHQTDTVTPVETSSSLPFSIDVSEVDFSATALPTLHSYASGQVDGKWVILAGRTNGLHGFSSGVENFPPESQNRDVWVIDPVTKQSWSRSLESSGFTEYQLNALSSANTQFYQSGDRLYITGGYGLQSVDPTDGSETFGTFDTVSAVDLSGIADWVVSGTGSVTSHVRQISDPIAQVTGGAMYAIGDKTHLVFGQDFVGSYTERTEGTYTKQVRSFEIVDDGVNLSLTNISSTTPEDAYRRRDLNVFPVIKPDAGDGLEQGLVALSGGFTLNSGAWTVPVEIDADGTPTMADPTDSETFKQGFNGYHSAKLGLFSESTGEMHEFLFGGISLQSYDSDSDTIDTDNRFPFVNDITAVTIGADGSYKQTWIDEFPELFDTDGLRLRFGANAEFFLNEDLLVYENGVLRLDDLTEEVILGYIYGGLTSNGPHTRGFADVVSTASNRVFAVTFTPSAVPEPSTIGLLLLAGMGAVLRRGRS